MPYSLTPKVFLLCIVFFSRNLVQAVECLFRRMVVASTWFAENASMSFAGAALGDTTAINIQIKDIVQLGTQC